MPGDVPHHHRDAREHLDAAARTDFHLPAGQRDPAGASHGQLTDVLVSERLRTRYTRRPNLESENEFLHSLAQHLLTDPEHILEGSIEAVVRLCGAGSAGISLLDSDEGNEVFRWAAVGGAFKRQKGRIAPRFVSPCGFAFESQAPQLFSYPARYYSCLHGVEPEIVEALVVPLPDGTGTIWIVAHSEAVQFDGEHVRLLTGLATFMATSLRLLRLADEAKRGRPETTVDPTAGDHGTVTSPRPAGECPDGFEVQWSVPLRVDLVDRRDATVAAPQKSDHQVVVDVRGTGHRGPPSAASRTEMHEIRLAFGAFIEQVRLVVRDGRRLIRRLIALMVSSKRRTTEQATSRPAPLASVPLIVLRPTTAQEQIELDELVQSLEAEGHQVVVKGGRRVVYTEIADRRK